MQSSTFMPNSSFVAFSPFLPQPKVLLIPTHPLVRPTILYCTVLYCTYYHCCMVLPNLNSLANPPPFSTCFSLPPKKVMVQYTLLLCKVLPSESILCTVIFTNCICCHFLSFFRGRQDRLSRYIGSVGGVRGANNFGSLSYVRTVLREREREKDGREKGEKKKECC